MHEQLVNAIANMEEEEAVRLAQAMLDAGENPQSILDDCRTAMTIVGERYDEKQYFLPELIIGGDILKEIGELVKPRLQSETAGDQPAGTIVLGTVAGDIHDIGKDIVGFMLEVNNYEVHDLGVDVSAAAFVDKIRDVKPEIVAMSGFLTLAFDQMKVTVEAIEEAGVREEIKIMIGGAPMDDTVATYIGADAFGADASAAVKLAQQWTGEN